MLWSIYPPALHHYFPVDPLKNETNAGANKQAQDPISQLD